MKKQKYVVITPEGAVSILQRGPPHLYIETTIKRHVKGRKYPKVYKIYKDKYHRLTAKNITDIFEAYEKNTSKS